MKQFGGPAAFIDRNDINTDEIIPAKYLTEISKKALAPHLLEDLRLEGSEFDPHSAEMQAARVLVTRANFGCGSSREHAPIAIKNAGIACVVARSFARIFYRNAVNTGLPIVETGAEIDTGDELEIDLAAGTLKNLTKGTEASFPPFPDFLQNIIDAGGLLEAMKKM